MIEALGFQPLTGRREFYNIYVTNYNRSALDNLLSHSELYILDVGNSPWFIAVTTKNIDIQWCDVPRSRIETIQQFLKEREPGIFPEALEPTTIGWIRRESFTFEQNKTAILERHIRYLWQRSYYFKHHVATKKDLS